MRKPIEAIATDEGRLRAALARVDRAEKKAAAANTENEALRREIGTLRYSNFILQRNDEHSIEGNYRTRYEKLEEAMKIIRELARTEVNGIPHTPPTTLQPWSAPWWAKSAAEKRGADAPPSIIRTNERSQP